MGWVVGFEPTYTGATTLGLNHLTIPTMLVNFAYCCVAVSLVLGYVHRYAPFGTCSTRLALRKISCAYKFVRLFFFKKELATWNGLEPSTSSVTGWHSNQLNYRTAYFQLSMATDTVDDNGGRYRARTYDILLVRQTLSQLS